MPSLPSLLPFRLPWPCLISSVCIITPAHTNPSSGRDGQLKIFDTRTLKATHTFGAPEFIASINHYKATISPDGKYVAAGVDVDCLGLCVHWGRGEVRCP